jgi:hypothetical protein
MNYILRIHAKTLLFFILVLFSRGGFSQTQTAIAKNQDFVGAWESKESNYTLTIKKEKNIWTFVSYRFEPVYDKDGWKSYERKMGPGKEIFIKEKDLQISNSYSIKDQNYYVKITYDLITPTQMIASYKGMLDNEPYIRILVYHKED